MDKRIAYRNMESTPALEDYINKRMDKIERLVETERTPQYIDLVVTAEHSDVIYKVELNVSTPNYKIHMEEEGPDIHQQIDQVMDAMVDEIRHKKEKDSDHHNKPDYYKSA